MNNPDGLASGASGGEFVSAPSLAEQEIEQLKEDIVKLEDKVNALELELGGLYRKLDTLEEKQGIYKERELARLDKEEHAERIALRLLIARLHNDSAATTNAIIAMWAKQAAKKAAAKEAKAAAQADKAAKEATVFCGMSLFSLADASPKIPSNSWDSSSCARSEPSPAGLGSALWAFMETMCGTGSSSSASHSLTHSHPKHKIS